MYSYDMGCEKKNKKSLMFHRIDIRKSLCRQFEETPNELWKNISREKQTTDSLKTLLFIPEKNWQISECLYDDRRKKQPTWCALVRARLSNQRGVYSKMSSKCAMFHVVRKINFEGSRQRKVTPMWDIYDEKGEAVLITGWWYHDTL